MGADADGAVPFVVAQQDAFDPLAVVQFEEQFFRAVGGRAMFGDMGRPNLELRDELLAQFGGQVGHFVEACDPLLKEPLPHLARSIAWLPTLDEPVAQLSECLFEEGNHVGGRRI